MAEGARLPTRSSRLRASKILVVLCCTALAALLVLAVLLPHALSSWAWIVTFLLAAGVWSVLRRRTRAVAELAAHRLDERDLATRGRAAWWGLLTAISAGSLASLALVIAARLNTVHAQVILNRSGPILLTLMFAASLVPTLFLAATTDPSAEDDDEASDPEASPL